MNLKTVISIFLISFVSALAVFILYTRTSAYSDQFVFEENDFDLIKDNLKAQDKFLELAKPQSFKPTQITLDSFQHIVIVEEVGVDETGMLEVPTSYLTSGWYSKSAKPGENGNVIIDGHYDDPFGNPAAFWQLKNLKINDTVTLIDEVGNKFTYQVYDSFFVDTVDPKRTNYLKDTNEPVLTLVTCGGVWDPISLDYNKRLIVRAKLL